MKERFLNRGIGFYLTMIAAVVALLSDIVYVIIDNADRTFSLISFIVVLVGALSAVAFLFVDFDFLLFVPSAGYIVGFAFALRATLPSVSDLWNGVNFIGGNAALGIVFTALFLICSVLMAVSCFKGIEKKA